MRHLIETPYRVEEVLAQLQEDRQHWELREPMKRHGVRLLELPWPWPWAVLELGCPVVSMTWLDLSQKQKHMQVKPLYPYGLKEGAWLAIKQGTLDVEGAAWLESKGINWPSLPEEWRGRVVMMARFDGHTHAARDHWAHRSEEGAKWARGTVGWWLSKAVAIEPMEIEPGPKMIQNLYHLDPDYLPDLRERFLLSTWGLYRREPLISR